jgi:hypothetical protein
MSHTQYPLTPKVGTLESGKFDGWSGTHASYGRVSAQSAGWQSDKMLSGSFTFDDMILNRSVCQTMLKKNKSMVEYKGKKPGADFDLRRTLSRSTSQENFVDFKRYQKLMHDFGTDDQFYSSFQIYLKSKPYSPANRPEVISLYETDFVVRNCLGDDAPDFILYKVKEFAFSVAVQGELTWDEMR